MNKISEKVLNFFIATPVFKEKIILLVNFFFNGILKDLLIKRGFSLVKENPY